MQNKELCADAVAAELYASGVRYVFGHPGGEVVDLIEAFFRHKLEFVLVGHEAAAAFMAAAIGRITGVPGVCVSTLGPGACNLLLGVGSALLDRDPLLAISARTPETSDKRSQKQNIPLNEIFRPASKWSVSLDGSNTRQVITQAIELATQSPRGPVFLTLPNEVAVRSDSALPLSPKAPNLPIDSDSDLIELARILNQARYPIGVIGVALDAKNDAKAVRKFFSETDIPFVVLPQAKGVGDEDASNFLGVVASAAGDAHIVNLIEKSDVLLGVGFDTVESAQSWHFDRTFLSIANGPVGFKEFQPTLECIGDVSRLMDQLLNRHEGRSRWNRADFDRAKEQVKTDIRPKESVGKRGLSPFHVLHVLQDVLPEETIVAVDVGAHKMLTCQVWKSTVPGSFLVSNGMSSMGYGVPSTLVASLVMPRRPVIGIIGDGGFGMMVQELETAVRMRVKPLLVVFCDRSLAVIKVAQQSRNLPYRGVDFAPVNWADVAQGFGVKNVFVSTLHELSVATTNWLQKRELTVVAVPIEETLYRGLTY